MLEGQTKEEEYYMAFRTQGLLQEQEVSNDQLLRTYIFI